MREQIRGRMESGRGIKKEMRLVVWDSFTIQNCCRHPLENYRRNIFLIDFYKICGTELCTIIVLKFFRTIFLERSKP